MIEIATGTAAETRTAVEETETVTETGTGNAEEETGGVTGIGETVTGIGIGAGVATRIVMTGMVDHPNRGRTRTKRARRMATKKRLSSVWQTGYSVLQTWTCPQTQT